MAPYPDLSRGGAHIMRAVTDDKNSFPVDLDEVFEWIGYRRRDYAVRRLKVSFKEAVHYQEVCVERRANKYYLSLFCFEMLAIQGGGPVGDQFLHYFKSLEEESPTAKNAPSDELHDAWVALAELRAAEGLAQSARDRLQAMDSKLSTQPGRAEPGVKERARAVGGGVALVKVEEETCRTIRASVPRTRAQARERIVDLMGVDGEPKRVTGVKRSRDVKQEPTVTLGGAAELEKENRQRAPQLMAMRERLTKEAQQLKKELAEAEARREQQTKEAQQLKKELAEVEATREQQTNEAQQLKKELAEAEATREQQTKEAQQLKKELAEAEQLRKARRENPEAEQQRKERLEHLEAEQQKERLAAVRVLEEDREGRERREKLEKEQQITKDRDAEEHHRQEVQKQIMMQAAEVERRGWESVDRGMVAEYVAVSLYSPEQIYSLMFEQLAVEEIRLCKLYNHTLWRLQMGEMSPGLQQELETHRRMLKCVRYERRLRADPALVNARKVRLETEVRVKVHRELIGRLNEILGRVGIAPPNITDREGYRKACKNALLRLHTDKAPPHLSKEQCNSMFIALEDLRTKLRLK
eukprot:TRINITY_DN1084_c0_g1_i2.p1 TRINITY_DN1084_c0_g1~~TRINITY_DN1084_c0_g1_i2.p1  ORF type:complete len:584 (+),score=141.71 TRINITY_DN1084_c0_g1_i2:46-1797(+)